MIHLLGIDHKFQVIAFKPFVNGGLEASCNRPVAAAFESYLSALLDRLSATAICEEYSESLLESQQRIDPLAYLVCRKLAIERSLPHMCCDPDKAERSVLYAVNKTNERQEQENGYPIREAEWMRRIAPLLSTPSLVFVLGANHVTSMQRRLREANAMVSIVERDLVL